MGAFEHITSSTPKKPNLLALSFINGGCAPVIGETSILTPSTTWSSRPLKLPLLNLDACHMHLGKWLPATKPPDIDLFTFKSNCLGLSLKTSAASWLRGSSGLGSCNPSCITKSLQEQYAWIPTWGREAIPLVSKTNTRVNKPSKSKGKDKAFQIKS